MARKGPRVRVVSNRAVVINAVRQAMRRKVAAMGVETRKTVVNEVLVGQRSGRWYRVPGTKKRYRASREGEAPARRTGDLARSYKAGPLEETPGRVQVKVGSNLPYAPILQDPDGLNRPHLDTAVELCKPKYEQILRGEWGI